MVFLGLLFFGLTQTHAQEVDLVCNTVHTEGYQYVQSFTDVKQLEIGAVFWVKTDTDAHIGLFPNTILDMGQEFYEICIGCFGNSQSYIMKKNSGDPDINAYDKSSVSSSKFARTFVVKMAGGVISVTMDDELFMSYTDAKPLSIKSIGVSSYEWPGHPKSTNQALWWIPYKASPNTPGLPKCDFSDLPKLAYTIAEDLLCCNDNDVKSGNLPMYGNNAGAYGNNADGSTIAVNILLSMRSTIDRITAVFIRKETLIGLIVVAVIAAIFLIKTMTKGGYEEVHEPLIVGV